MWLSSIFDTTRSLVLNVSEILLNQLFYSNKMKRPNELELIIFFKAKKKNSFFI